MWEYVGIHCSDYLAHRSHKYILKVRKPGGDWRYYYKYDKSNNILDKIADKAGFDEKATYDKANRENKLYEEDLNFAKSLKEDPKNSASNVQKVIDDGISFRESQLRESQKIVNDTLQKYSKTPIYKIENSGTIGRKVINWLFELEKKR